jgi:hypothetical protein
VLGYTKRRNVRLHIVAFVVIVTLTMYVIFDLDYPRFGLIQLESSDQTLIDLLAGMK